MIQLGGSLKAMKRDLKVLYVSAEVAPFSKLGGLSQVSYFLPRALRKQGVDVRIFTPRYGTVDSEKYGLKMLQEGMEVPTGAHENENNLSSLQCNIKYYEQPDDPIEPPTYFLENMEYFEKRANVYGYEDDHIRFGLLSRGAYEFIKSGEFVPDVIHCNDWHTSYLINYLEEMRDDDDELKEIASLLTIHNTYRGNFDFDRASEMDFDDGKSPLASFFSERFKKQNALKRGIMFADRVNTVSENYARELLLEQYSGSLHRLLRELRGKLSGILNGLDYVDFNPADDKIIKQNYTVNSIEKRRENKIDLQQTFGLDEDENVPILAVSGRLDHQKGIGLVCDVMDFVLKEMEVQLVVLGSGDPGYTEYFESLERQYPGRVGTHLMADFKLPRKIFAGADILMLPSYYEPGGIVAIEAMRYGAIPIVRATGGLADIVDNYNPNLNKGTGFTFKDFSKESFLVALVRALETYRRRDDWKQIVERAMQQDFSWDNVASKYISLYRKTKGFREEATKDNPPMAYQQQVTLD